jgi:hypothetical protein
MKSDREKMKSNRGNTRSDREKLIAPEELDELRKSVSRHFYVIEESIMDGIVLFKISPGPEKIEDSYESLKGELDRTGWIPFIKKERGEFVLAVAQMPSLPKPKPVWINFLLLALAIITTALAGSQLWLWLIEGVSTESGYPPWGWILFEPEYLKKGVIYYSIPLLSILGFHEFGHYIVSRFHNVQATPPYFIPLPPLPHSLTPGTLGAVIMNPGAIPDRRVLLHVGLAGPLAGFLVGIPVCFAGINLALGLPPPDITEGGFYFASPFIMIILEMMMDSQDVLSLHPTLFAAWIGMIVTAINLLPAGQLDGGHVAYAMLGDKQKYTGILALLLMMGLGFFFPTWLFFAFIILMIGLRHPPPLNDLTPLAKRDKLLCMVAIFVFLMTFVPIPIVAPTP